MTSFAHSLDDSQGSPGVQESFSCASKIAGDYRLDPFSSRFHHYHFVTAFAVVPESSRLINAICRHWKSFRFHVSPRSSHALDLLSAASSLLAWKSVAIVLGEGEREKVGWYTVIGNSEWFIGDTRSDNLMNALYRNLNLGHTDRYWWMIGRSRLEVVPLSWNAHTVVASSGIRLDPVSLPQSNSNWTLI